MSKIKKYLFFFTLLFGLSEAQANIQVFPTRVNLSPTNKTATVSIRLRSNKPETFRISTMFYQMSYDGSVKQRPELSRSAESAAPYLRFSPKRVQLQPNVEQVVRIRVKNISKLSSEVRTHLYFRPSDPSEDDPIKKNIGNGKSAFELKAQVAVAIPVIISPGKIKKDFSLKNFKVFIAGNEVKFKVQLEKKGKGFLYGDFTVYKVDGSKKSEVGVAKGVSSYISKREVSYGLVNKASNPLTKGTYRLVYNEYSQTKPEKGQKKSIDYIFN